MSQQATRIYLSQEDRELVEEIARVTRSKSMSGAVGLLLARYGREFLEWWGGDRLPATPTTTMPPAPPTTAPTPPVGSFEL